VSKVAVISCCLVSALSCAAAAQAAPVSVGHSGWTWGNPQPQGNDLTKVEFAGNRGYAVGTFGTILRTDDGGTNWSGLRSAERAAYNRLRVIDADSFVFGSQCALRRSDDGGATFSRLRFSAGSGCQTPVTAFHFPTNDVGYLVRQDSTVLRTPDGGRTFAATAQVPTSGRTVHDTFFTSADTGFVVEGSGPNGRIHRTTNGGQDWTEVAVETRNLLGIFFVDSQNGYAVGEGGAVLRSTDGGTSWSRRPAPGNPSLSSVRCSDADSCVMTTGGDAVISTDDGGETYSTASPGFSTPSAAFATGNRVVAVGQRGGTALSDDGGASFVRKGGDIAAELPGTFGRLRATSPSVAHAAGPAGTVARTTDGGTTWSRVRMPTSNAITDVSFPDASNGYAVDSAGGVFSTDNGGTSWSILDSGGGDRPRGVIAVDAATALLVINRGLRRTTNGGEGFETVSDRDARRAALTDVDRTAGGALFGYGRRALILSSDKGASWATLRRPSRSSIVDADFVSSNVGYVLTADGRVWRTGNRARRWTELRTTGTQGGYSLSFGSASNGYLAIGDFNGEDGGWVLRTSNGGKSWRPQLVSAQAVDREGVAATSNIDGYLLTGGTNLFSTTSGGDQGADSAIQLRASRPDRRNNSRVSGTLSPARAGREVVLSTRDERSNRWRRRTVETDASGRFSLVYKISRTTLIVAQWAGDELADPDGSAMRRIRARR
jgi:photosystem II stability/assembly factor-like uncharacterized protein